MPTDKTIDVTIYKLRKTSEISLSTGVQKFCIVRHRGFRALICPTKRVCYTVETAAKGLNFQFKMHNIQYLLDNVSYIY